MIIIIEILFAIWAIYALASVAIGLTWALLGLAAFLAGWALTVLSKSIEILCIIWQTAFSNDGKRPNWP